MFFSYPQIPSQYGAQYYTYHHGNGYNEYYLVDPYVGYYQPPSMLKWRGNNYNSYYSHFNPSGLKINGHIADISWQNCNLYDKQDVTRFQEHTQKKKMQDLVIYGLHWSMIQI